MHINEMQISAHCNPKGRVESLFYLIKTNHIENNFNNFHLIMPADIIEIAKKKLEFFGRFSSITFEIEENSVENRVENSEQNAGVFLIQGPDALKNIKKTFKLSQENSNIITKKPNSCIHLNQYIICRLPSVSKRELRILYFKKQDISNQNTNNSENNLLNKKITQYLSPKNVDKKFAMQLWHTYELENNIPYLTSKTIGKFTPYELGLLDCKNSAHNIISFDKGCYTGQEIIARMHYLGKQKKINKKIHLITKNPLSDEMIEKFHGETVLLHPELFKNKPELNKPVGEFICIAKEFGISDKISHKINNKNLDNKDNINIYSSIVFIDLSTEKKFIETHVIMDGQKVIACTEKYSS